MKSFVAALAASAFAIVAFADIHHDCSTLPANSLASGQQTLAEGSNADKCVIDAAAPAGATCAAGCGKHLEFSVGSVSDRAGADFPSFEFALAELQSVGCKYDADSITLKLREGFHLVPLATGLSVYMDKLPIKGAAASGELIIQGSSSSDVAETKLKFVDDATAESMLTVYGSSNTGRVVIKDLQFMFEQDSSRGVHAAGAKVEVKNVEFDGCPRLTHPMVHAVAWRGVPASVRVEDVVMTDMFEGVCAEGEGSTIVLAGTNKIHGRRSGSNKGVLAYNGGIVEIGNLEVAKFEWGMEAAWGSKIVGNPATLNLSIEEVKQAAMCANYQSKITLVPETVSASWDNIRLGVAGAEQYAVLAGDQSQITLAGVQVPDRSASVVVRAETFSTISIRKADLPAYENVNIDRPFAEPFAAAVDKSAIVLDEICLPEGASQSTGTKYGGKVTLLMNPTDCAARSG